MALLERYVARDVAVSAGDLSAWSTGLVEAQQCARLQREATICGMIATWPRRLGQDASDNDLARDTKLGKRMRHAFARVLTEWGGNPELMAGPQDELKRLAAVRQWDEFVATHRTLVEATRIGVATHAHAAGERQWGNRAVHLLTMELQAVEYAAR